MQLDVNSWYVAIAAATVAAVLSSQAYVAAELSEPADRRPPAIPRDPLLPRPATEGVGRPDAQFPSDAGEPRKDSEHEPRGERNRLPEEENSQHGQRQKKDQAALEACRKELDSALGSAADANQRAMKAEAGRHQLIEQAKRATALVRQVEDYKKDIQVYRKEIDLHKQRLAELKKPPSCLTIIPPAIHDASIDRDVSGLIMEVQRKGWRVRWERNVTDACRNVSVNGCGNRGAALEVDPATIGNFVVMLWQLNSCARGERDSFKHDRFSDMADFMISSG